ncbi:MAG: ATP-binding protein [Nevskiales bacterium]
MVGSSDDREQGESPGATARYTPKHLVDKVLVSRAAMEGERKRVTVLFVDIQDSMDLSQMVGAENWHEILDGFFSILTENVHAFEGTVNQYTGDGIMALFGAPVAHEDHARRACHAALRIRDELRHYAQQQKLQRNIELHCRIGVNSGDVIVGKIGDDLRMDYTAHGHVVGIAARMEEAATPDAIYLAEHTAALVEGLCDLKAMGAIKIKGLREPVEVYELLSARPERSSFGLKDQAGLSSFVNRDPEFDFLKTALERAQSGRGQAVAIVGGPGLGKSRLCYQFERHGLAQGYTVHKAHGVPNGRWLSFFPALMLMRSYLGIQDSDSPEQARDKIRENLLKLGPEVEPRLARAYEYLGVAKPGLSTQSIHPELRRRRDLELIRWALIKMPRQQAVVLILEDLQWFDDSSLEIVNLLVRAVHDSQVLIVLNHRPEFKQPWMQDESQCHRLVLPPLAPDHSRELARGILLDSRGLDELAGLIADAASGNPFFTEEIIQDLADGGVIEGKRGAYRLVRPIESFAVPASVQDVLAARVDRLPEGDKQVLQAAAVIGREFPLAVLKATVDLPLNDLEAALDRLNAAEFITQAEVVPRAVYSFKHALTQEAVYRSLLRDKRARLHALVADTIQKLPARNQDENAALLAHHWEAAGETIKAVFAYHQAAEWVVRKDARQSLNYRRKLIKLLEGQPLTPATRRIYIGARRHLLSWAPVGASLSPKEAESLFQEGCAAADADSVLDLGQLYGAYAIYQALCHSFARGVELSERCSELLGNAGQPVLQIYAETLVKPICYSSVGRPRQEHKICERALRILKQQGVPPVIDGASPYVWAATFHAMSTANLGDLPKAMQLLKQTAELARESTDTMLMNLLGVQARFRYFIGVPGDAQDCTREALDLAKQYNAEHWLAQAHYYRGVAHVLHEQWSEARQHFEQSRAHGRHGEMMFAVYGVSTAWLAYALVRTAEPAGASALIEEALKLAEERESRWILQEALMMRCAVLRETQGRAAAKEIQTTLDRWDASIDENGAEMYRHMAWLERARLAELMDDSGGRTKALKRALAAAKKAGAEGYVARLEQELRNKNC